LRSAGLRVTTSRLAVLAAARAGNHATIGDIAAAAREQIDSISTQAVYDALAALGRAGLVARIEPAGSPARYETRVSDNHHHHVVWPVLRRRGRRRVRERRGTVP
jgi:Fur family ferric uptake transcriptional regulator